MTATRGNLGSLKTHGVVPYITEQSVTPTMPPTSISTGSPQYSITFSKATMSPEFTGNSQPISWRTQGVAYLCGQNTSGASVTLYYQINKNGSSWKSGSSSIVNNNYYTLYFLDNFNDGDKFDFYIWSSATSGMNYLYQGFCCFPNRVNLGAKNMYNATFTLYQPTFTLTGHCGNSWYGNFFVYPIPSNTNNLSLGNASFSPITVPFVATHPTYGQYVTQGGDIFTNSGINSSSTTYPQINYTPQVQLLTYREIFLGR